MLSGIVFQLASTLVFTGLFIYIIVRANKKGNPALEIKKVWWVIAATALSVLCIIIRGIYRTIELQQGFKGELMTTQKYVLGLDGSMMILSVAVFNVINPGWSNAQKDTLKVEPQSETEVEGQKVQV